MPGTSLYGPSKAALVLLTKAWAAEFGAIGVRVNPAPGAPGPAVPRRCRAQGVSGRPADGKKCVWGRSSRWPHTNRSTFSL